MKIREAWTADAAALDGLLTELIRYEHRYDENLNPGFAVTDNYGAMIGREDCRIWAAEEDGELCGYLCALVCNFPVYVRPVVILDALYVREEHRRKGIATALMARAKDFAASIGAQSIELKVYSANDAAAGLYREHGFTETKKYLHWEVLP